MLTPNGMTNTISFFIHWVKETSPAVRPLIIMTDHDQAQMAALQQVYPESRMYLCMWHVLRAMRSHFVITEFPELWEKIQAWVRTKDLAEFHWLWDEISSDPSAPESFVRYLTVEWMPVSHLWSRTVRNIASIFEAGDTNMLIEA
jgi:MULE transposase domain